MNIDRATGTVNLPEIGILVSATVRNALALHGVIGQKRKSSLAKFFTKSGSSKLGLLWDATLGAKSYLSMMPEEVLVRL